MDAEPGPSPGSIAVEVSDTQRHLALDSGRLAGLARRVLARRGVDRAELSIALVDDATIHAVNRVHLDHDWPTDVIAFRLSEPGASPLVAEVVVSTEMAARTAAGAGTAAADELALYLVHGLLHLCGFDDRSQTDARRMRAAEAEELAAEGLTNTFAAVGPDRPGGPGPEVVP